RPPARRVARRRLQSAPACHGPVRGRGGPGAGAGGVPAGAADRLRSVDRRYGCRSTPVCASAARSTVPRPNGTGCWVVDEVGYLPLARQAANLLSALVSQRYERGSIIVTSNRGFEHWGDILWDVIIAALIDRLAHHPPRVPSHATRHARAHAPTP